MNQVATQNRTQSVQVTAGGNVSALVPQNIEEAFRVATAVSRAGMAPYGMDTPEKCLIAIMAGAEVGLPPMQSVQNIAVINNRPSMWGDALVGVVRASGLCSYIKEWVEGEGDDRIAYCETLRKGETEPVKKHFSVAQAITARLWQTEARVTKRAKGGGTYEADNDSPWFKYPERMLQMRARALCLRDVYADVLKGLQVREEVEDFQGHIGPDNAKDVTPSPSARKYLPGSPDAPQTLGEANIDATAGFNADQVDAEIETLADTPPVGSEAEDDAPATTTPTGQASSSVLFEVWGALKAIFDMDEFSQQDDPMKWAKNHAGVVMGKLQSGVLATVDTNTHDKAKAVLSAFKAVCDEERSIQQVEEWLNEMEGGERRV